MGQVPQPPDAEIHIQVRCCVLGAGCWLQGVEGLGSWRQVLGAWSLVIGLWSWVIGLMPLVFGLRSLVIGLWDWKATSEREECCAVADPFHTKRLQGTTSGPVLDPKNAPRA